MRGVEIKTDKLAAIVSSINMLVKKSVLVGIPASGNGRDDEMNNAALGYIHETGSPANNIPARPFLLPSVADSLEKYEPHLKKAALAALDGQNKKVYEQLNSAGIIASQAAKAMIDAGAFAPLAIATLKARARRGRKGAAIEIASRAAGNAPNSSNARPLIDTGQMRNAITYIVRE